MNFVDDVINSSGTGWKWAYSLEDWLDVDAKNVSFWSKTHVLNTHAMFNVELVTWRIKKSSSRLIQPHQNIHVSAPQHAPRRNVMQLRATGQWHLINESHILHERLTHDLSRRNNFETNRSFCTTTTGYDIADQKTVRA